MPIAPQADAGDVEVTQFDVLHLSSIRCRSAAPGITHPGGKSEEAGRLLESERTSHNDHRAPSILHGSVSATPWRTPNLRPTTATCSLLSSEQPQLSGVVVKERRG